MQTSCARIFTSERGIGTYDARRTEHEGGFTDTTAITTLGLLIPLAGTTLGAAFVFLLRNGIRPHVQNALLGFAAGVMIAASVWSLLIPSIEMAETQGAVTWMPALIGFGAGIAFLLAFDHFLPHQHLDSDTPEGLKCNLGKSTMLVFAVALHNLPEGMAVGVVFAGFLSGDTNITLAGAFVMAAGIAIQNIPEGAIISLPLRQCGCSKPRSFFYGFLTGVIEPVGAVLTILLASAVTPALPYILAFAAGAMIYVVVEELIPESQMGEHNNIGTIGVAVGFALMMVLDVALG